jgi:RNA polymerase sigma-70 factor (ECF subfamily)
MEGGLVERARAGDAEAFDELGRSRIDQMYRTALGILGSPADARDATQETLVSMWRGLPSLRSTDAFDAWLYRLTVNASKMILRRRRGVREISLDPDTDVPVVSEFHDGAFNAAFDRLSVDQRALLVGHHLDGLSVVELAAKLKIPAGTVKSRLFAARAALDKALGDGER